jgi:DNA modification methylase
MQQESLQIPDSSVNLIFTDPPYEGKSLYLYDSLALHGHRVLKAGGSLVTYAGHYAISQIIQDMEARDLHYYWIFAVVHTGPFSSIFAKNILVRWKPLLWFVQAKREKPHQKIFDLINSTKPNKILHSWAQSPEEARYIIDQLTKPGELVFDPFMGSGTTGIAAIKLKRKFVGIEIDKGVLEIAKRNLSSEHSFLESSRREVNPE